jgi:transposase
MPAPYKKPSVGPAQPRRAVLARKDEFVKNAGGVEITDLLNLTGFEYVSHVETEHDIARYVNVTTQPENCHACGSPASMLERWGYTKLTYAYDAPECGKRVRLYYAAQRYRCKNVHGDASCVTSKQPLPSIDESKRMTFRLKQYILLKAFQRTTTNVSISEETGVPESTIRNIVADRIEEWQMSERPQTPEWLAIDEVHLGKTGTLCVITAPAEKRLVDILEYDDQMTLLRALVQLPGRDCVKQVSMDICGKYKTVVETVFPKADVVFDRRHVQEMARRALSAFLGHLENTKGKSWCRQNMHDRRLLYKRYHELETESSEKGQMSELEFVERWLHEVPEIGAAYRAKEDFCNLFEVLEQIESERRYDEWEKKVLSEAPLAPFFCSVVREVRRHREQIFKYVEYRERHSVKITNGYAEAINNQIRRLYRICNGMDVNMLRGKLLIGRSIGPRPPFFLDAEKPKTNRKGVKRKKGESPGPNAHSTRLRAAREQRDETIGIIPSPMENEGYAKRFEHIQEWIELKDRNAPLAQHTVGRGQRQRRGPRKELRRPEPGRNLQKHNHAGGRSTAAGSGRALPIRQHLQLSLTFE